MQTIRDSLPSARLSSHQLSLGLWQCLTLASVPRGPKVSVRSSTNRKGPGRSYRSPASCNHMTSYTGSCLHSAGSWGWRLGTAVESCTLGYDPSLLTASNVGHMHTHVQGHTLAHHEYTQTHARVHAGTFSCLCDTDMHFHTHTSSLEHSAQNSFLEVTLVLSSIQF